MSRSPYDKGLYIKLYIIICLTACIFGGLLFLVFNHQTGSHDKVIAAVTETPSESSETAASASTEPTASITPSPTPSPSALPSPAVENGPLTQIVNVSRQIDANYVPSDLTSVSVQSDGDVQLRAEAASALASMFDAAAHDGVNMKVAAGYYSYSQLQSLYSDYLNDYGLNIANTSGVIPGASEHQLGLLVDLAAADGSCAYGDCFTSTDMYYWLLDHAAEYGFIERYPYDQMDITGVSYSPWTYRYIGADAPAVQASGLCLESYYG
jgi:D-alanyl-D-alanine carboxypeptidase